MPEVAEMWIVGPGGNQGTTPGTRHFKNISLFVSQYSAQFDLFLRRIIYTAQTVRA
jgi:hypothetical protein